MIDVFVPLKGFLKVGKGCSYDNTVFRLHYRVTVILLVISMLLVTSKQLFGDSINCITTGTKGPVYKEALNNYCWMYGTYTVRKHFEGEVGKHFASPGVGPDTVPEDIVSISYYQWVCVVLMLQAIMFYWPHYLWKIWENGRVRALTQNLDGPSVPAEWASSRRADLIDYLTNSKMFQHDLYAIRFAFCECLNLINVVVQIYMVNWLLGGTFLTYGAAVAALVRAPDALGDMRSADPMALRFPKMAKCRFHYYGGSGGVQWLDALCVLPLNVVHEKVYIVMWFWLITLAGVSAIKVIHTCVVLSCAPLRGLLLAAHVRGSKQAASLAHRLSFGDWFMLRQLADNLNPIAFRDLVAALSDRLDSV